MPEPNIVEERAVETPAGTPILIADDSLVSRRLLETVLRKWGYRVISVPDGSQAWEILQAENSPRLAILDWMMPGLTGPEVCRLVREQAQPQYIYLILLTSRHEKEDLIAGMESGADDYLIKPVDNNELKVRLGPGRRIVELQSELMKAQELLRLQATRDALTSVWNRRAIFEILEKERVRCQREGRPLALAMGDLDFFKQVNDTLGHIGGDEVLREVAVRMMHTVRPYDAIGRYGGEEFLIILPGCDAEMGGQAAERLRHSIEARPIPVNGQELHVTSSFGVAAQLPGDDRELATLLRSADEALYQAKQDGRNRTVVAPLAGPGD